MAEKKKSSKNPRWIKMGSGFLDRAARSLMGRQKKNDDAVKKATSGK